MFLVFRGVDNIIPVAILGSQATCPSAEISSLIYIVLNQELAWLALGIAAMILRIAKTGH